MLKKPDYDMAHFTDWSFVFRWKQVDEHGSNMMLLTKQCRTCWQIIYIYKKTATHIQIHLTELFYHLTHQCWGIMWKEYIACDCGRVNYAILCPVRYFILQGLIKCLPYWWLMITVASKKLRKNLKQCIGLKSAKFIPLKCGAIGSTQQQKKTIEYTTLFKFEEFLFYATLYLNSATKLTCGHFINYNLSLEIYFKLNKCCKNNEIVVDIDASIMRKNKYNIVTFDTKIYFSDNISAFFLSSATFTWEKDLNNVQIPQNCIKLIPS